MKCKDLLKCLGIAVAVAIIIITIIAGVWSILGFDSNTNTTDTENIEYTENAQYSESYADRNNYEYKIVYRPNIDGLCKTLYFNGTVTISSMTTYAKGDNFELCVKDGILMLNIGNNTIVTSDFSITNNFN